MRKILTVIGARPQFIKAAPVSRRIAADPGLEECMVHTGQHFDGNMSGVFFEELGLPEPDHGLDVSGGPHGRMTGRMLERLEEVMTAERPRAVLVYGDTNSTLAGALAAAKLGIPVAHVEAGLRSFNRAMPEEINRVLADRCADLLFTPTRAATGNLLAESVPRDRICEVGDVMYDAARLFGRRAEARTDVVDRTGLRRGGYVLATVHRQENTDDPERLAAILGALTRLAESLPVVLPLHPRTRKRADEAGLRDRLSMLTMLEPVGFLDMVALERGAAVIATDSGGVQKEAFFHRVPCVTLRDETEWTELVAAGWNRLASPGDPDGIVAAILSARGSLGKEVAPYGDGDAAGRIVLRLADLV